MQLLYITIIVPILLINVKMPIIVLDILTFISGINASSEYFKQEKIVIFSVFYFL